jgi:predicted NUDIX family NTP pyrophosphohydrolase
MKQSAGTLLYRLGAEGLDVLLVHPSGAYNRKAPWSIPKGLPGNDEDLETAARRETEEETGLTVAGPLVMLGSMVYKKNRKEVHCFAGPAPADVAPRCGSWEVDQACFLPLARAREVLHPDQVVFLDRLEEKLDRGELPAPGR